MLTKYVLELNQSQNMRYNISLLLFLLYLSGIVQIEAQIQLVPLSHNENLLKKNKRSELGRDHYTDTYILNVQAGKTESYCIDLGLVSGGFDTMEIIRPLIPTGGTATVDKECLTYESDDLTIRRTDSFELRVLDVDEFEYFFLVVVNVIPSSNLPFIDEFSYDGPYPDAVKWLDRFAFINDAFAIKPPSFGVATLDGINDKGNPYGRGGISDHLTSTFLNIENAVDPVFEFLYQPRGYGFELLPLEHDSLIVEFRNPSGNWINIYSIPGIGDTLVPDFQYVQIPIPDSLVYDGFQFRFKNISDGQGIQSLWHLDYIQVRDKSINEEVYPDVALRQAPSSLFKRYTAIPSAHFVNNVEAFITDSNEISIGNYFPGLKVMDNSRVLITEAFTNTNILERADEENLLKSSAVAGENQIDLDSGSYVFQNKIQTRSLIVNRIEAMNTQKDDSLNFRMTYTFQNDERSLAFERNNTITRDNWVNDYYAYDDGTAELGLYIAGGGEFDMVALQYEIPEGDSLKGIRMSLPHVFKQGDRERFKLMVWGANLEDGPIYEKLYDDPVFPDDYEEIVGAFTNFGLKDDDGNDIALYIPEGKFHIGWQQVSQSSKFGLYVGFDRNNTDATQYIRYNKSGIWQEISASSPVKGAIMMRPVFGPKVQYTTDVNDKVSLHQLLLFPSPATDILHLKGDFLKLEQHYIQILDMQGRQMLRTPYKEQLNIAQLPSGMYIVRITDQQQQLQAIQKFIKQ